MQSKKKSVIREMEYNEAPLLYIPGMIEVASVNQHGFTVVTNHIYERGAAWEREQRKALGHEMVEEVAA